ncbi:MAG: hypothetical protein MJE66_24615 [Proteobacteria bacterium]|nr:hypothetical protein [Pseudomonadota bacterium]
MIPQATTTTTTTSRRRQPAAPEPKPEVSADDRAATLFRMLRGIGAAVLVASASTFLLQQWQAGSDITRYLTLLAQTGLLSAAGLFCGITLKESKGARTLLALTLATLPVHFAVLGGFVYSQFHWDAGPGSVPPYVSWVASSAPAAVAIAVGALALLAPLAWVSLMALARKQAARLAPMFLAVNAALLVPVRDGNAMAVLLAVLVAGVGCYELLVMRRETTLQTFEGRLVRGFFAVPILLVAARSVALYEPTSLLVAALWWAVAFVLFALVPTLFANPREKAISQAISTLPLAAGWAFVAEAAFRAGLPREAFLPLLTLPFAGSLVALSAVAAGSGAGYRRAAAIAAIVGGTSNLVLFDGVFASFTCLVVAIGTLAYGYWVEQKAIFLAGVAGSLFGLLYHVRYAVELYAVSHWGSLAALGIAIILIASFFERNRNQLLGRAAALRHRVEAWDY